MSPTGGYQMEMPDPDPNFDDGASLERAIDAILVGRSNPAPGLDWLASFVEDLGAVAAEPAPVVSPALALLLAEGISTAQPRLAPRPKWRKKMLIGELISGISARLAGVGMAAKAGMGLTVAAMSVTGAAAAGVLPAPVQHAVAKVVETTTPFEMPDLPAGAGLATIGGSANVGTGETDDRSGKVGDGLGHHKTDPKDDGEDGTREDGAGNDSHVRDNHGACVSAVAKSAPRGPGGVHGKAVSAAAHSCSNADDDDATTTTTVVNDDADDADPASTSKGSKPKSDDGPSSGRGDGSSDRSGPSGSSGPGNPHDS